MFSQWGEGVKRHHHPSGHKFQFNVESTLNQHLINIDNQLSMLIQCSVPTGMGAMSQPRFSWVSYHVSSDDN